MSGRAILDFAVVYDAYHDQVRAWAAKLMGPDEADDIAQEVFVKVGRALGTLEDPAKLAPWIHAITLNTVRDLARRRAARPQLVTLAPGPPAPEGAAEPALAQVPDAHTRGPEECAMRAEMVACFLGHVERLPETYREVYVLGELEELPGEAIARRLSLPLGTVKMRLHRARARINRELRSACEVFYSERGELLGAPRED